MFLDTSVTDLPSLYRQRPNVALLLPIAPSIRLRAWCSPQHASWCPRVQTTVRSRTSALGRPHDAPCFHRVRCSSGHRRLYTTSGHGEHRDFARRATDVRR